MDRQKLALSVGIIVLGFACFVLGCISVAIPYWGTFRSRVREERGHFGPWTMCKDIGYGRDLCGQAISSFRLMTVVRAAGICAAIGTATLGLYGLASIFQISMQVTRSRIIFAYHHIVFIKLVCSVCTAMTILAAVCLFAVQSDDLERGYIIEASFCFYMEVVLAIFAFILMLLTIVEYTTLRKLRLNLLLSGAQAINSNGRSSFRGSKSIGAIKSRPPRPPGGATMKIPGQTTNLLPQMGFGTTIGNPGFRDAGGGGGGGGVSIHTNGIAMTDSSARFVVPSVSSQSILYNNNTNNYSLSTISRNNSGSNSKARNILNQQYQLYKHQRPLPPQLLQINKNPTQLASSTNSSLIINNPNLIPSGGDVAGGVGVGVGITPGGSSSSINTNTTTVSSLPKSPRMSRLALARQLSIEKKERKKARKMIRAVVANNTNKKSTGGGGGSTGDGKRSKSSNNPSRSPSPAPSSSSTNHANINSSSIKKSQKVKTKKSFFNFRSSHHEPTTTTLATSSSMFQNPSTTTTNPTTPSSSSMEWTNDSISIVPTPESVYGESTMSDVTSLSTISTIASTMTPSLPPSLPRGPLRSSLKKPKPVSSTPDDNSIDSIYGIQNPGFSTTSPTLSRTGSLKKVRIQTMSTDV